MRVWFAEVMVRNVYVCNQSIGMSLASSRNSRHNSSSEPWKVLNLQLSVFM